MQSTVQQATIQDLPLEVLVEIFDYLPKNNHKNLALVSKNFYGAICELEKFKYPLEITPYTIVNPELYEGLQHSSRRFNYIIIKECQTPQFLGDLFALLDHHGSGITKMRLELNGPCLGSASQICMKIFMKVPRLQELALDFHGWSIAFNERSDILTELNTLTVKCYISSFKIFSLRPNSIKKLTVETHWNGFDEFMDRQLAITELSIHESNFTQSFEDHKLVKFTLFVDVEANPRNGPPPKVKDTTSDLLVKLINAHSQLKSFNAYKKSSSPLQHVALRGDVIKALCDLPCLEKLSIVATTIVDKSDLERCTAIEVDFYGTRPFRSQNISVVDILSMKNLQKLTVNGMYFFLGFHDDIKSPNLRCLFLNNCTTTHFIKILMAFEGLETLQWTLKSTSYANITFTKTENVIHPRLKYLKITGEVLFNGAFSKFLNAMPNLKSLHSDMDHIPYNMTNIKKLAAMPNLKDLEISLHKGLHGCCCEKSLRALKKLCQRVEKFKIFFESASDDFSNVLKREFSQYYEVHETSKGYRRGWMLRNC